MNNENKQERGVHRRTFLKGAALGLAAAALPAADANASLWEAFFQKHFQEMNEAEIRKVIQRLEREYAEKYKKQITVGNEKPIPGVLYGYGLDLSCCIGCRRCVARFCGGRGGDSSKGEGRRHDTSSRVQAHMFHRSSISPPSGLPAHAPPCPRRPAPFDPVVRRCDPSHLTLTRVSA